MFYIIGEYGRNYFVYDTDDNSCELISMRELKNSGIYTERIKDNMDLTRLRLMYKLEEETGYWARSIVSYTLPYEMNEYNDLDIGYSFNLIIAKLSDLIYDEDRDFELSMYYKYGYMDKYAAVACYTEVNSNTYYRGTLIDKAYNVPSRGTSQRDYSKTPVLTRIGIVRHLDIGNMNFLVRGMIIPLRMYDYTMRLAQKQDLSGIFRSYANLFDQRLIVDGHKAEVYRDGKMVKVQRRAGHIKWGSSCGNVLGV